MTIDNTPEEDQVRTSKQSVEEQGISDVTKSESVADKPNLFYSDKTIGNINNNETSEPSSSSTISNANPSEPCSKTAATTPIVAPSPVTNGDSGEGGSTCYNKVLDDEIRSRLDKLNALSELINSLERKFDEANSEFRQTLKCSTSRLSSIAKAVGTKSIRQSRVYHTAKVSVEQSQSDCQRACVQFEQANKDHQFAKNAIRNAESKLKEMTVDGGENCVISNFNAKLNIHDSVDQKEGLEKEKGEEQREKMIACDTNNAHSLSFNLPEKTQAFLLEAQHAQVTKNDDDRNEEKSTTNSTSMINNAAKLSEELNQAITKLIEAERKRGQSERMHLDQANKLMLAQENLIRLEREIGPTTIKRTQLYFDEAKRFNARLASVKGDICRINEDILRAKQAYARTLKDLEQFSDDLHESSEKRMVN